MAQKWARPGTHTGLGMYSPSTLVMQQVVTPLALIDIDR